MIDYRERERKGKMVRAISGVLLVLIIGALIWFMLIT